MDVDQPLDALVQQNQKPRSNGPRRSSGPANERRQSGGVRRERDAVPYARPTPRSTDQQWVHDAYTGPGARRGPRGSAGGAPAQPFTGVSPRIVVTGIHYEVSQQDLKSIFQQAGTLVEGPTIEYDRSGRSTGLARMEYATPQQAKTAINKFDGAMTKGQTISIKLDYPAPPKQATAASGGAFGNFGNKGDHKVAGGSLLSRISGAGIPAAREERRQPSARGARGGGRGAASGARGRRAASGTKSQRKAPATQEDLDKELEGFMGRDAPAPAAAAPATDVEMS